MTAPIPAIASPPPSLPGRDSAPPLIAAAQRLAQPQGAETGRALRPVDAANPLADPRLALSRERPVGPPPAFAITLLQHLRETAFDPPPPGQDGAPAASAWRDGPPTATQTRGADQPPLPAPGASGAVAPDNKGLPSAARGQEPGAVQMDRRL